MSLLSRLSVLGVGVAFGLLFALFVAGPMMPEGMRVGDRAQVGAWVMAGPVVGTILGVSSGGPLAGCHIGLGWLSLLLILAHPVRPNVATGVLTALGLVLWFFSGFLTVIMVVWGA